MFFCICLYICIHICVWMYMYMFLKCIFDMLFNFPLYYLPFPIYVSMLLIMCNVKVSISDSLQLPSFFQSSCEKMCIVKFTTYMIYC